MRSFIFAVAVMVALPIDAAQSDDMDQIDTSPKSCTKGVLFRSSESGIVVTVIRQGFGKAVFTEDKNLLQPATAAEILTKEGDHGFIYGPMRSYMFAVDSEALKDFNWRPAESDPNAFYTVRTDDGSETRFNLVDVGCAP